MEVEASRAARTHAPSFAFRASPRSHAYDAEPMVGVGLGRLWDTHPRVAFVLQFLVTVYLGALVVWLFVTGATGGGVALTIGFAVMAWSLLLLLWLAAQNHWQANDTSYDGKGQVIGPRAAWTNTQVRGRIFWVLFGIVFLSALVLLNPGASSGPR